MPNLNTAQGFLFNLLSEHFLNFPLDVKPATLNVEQAMWSSSAASFSHCSVLAVFKQSVLVQGIQMWIFIPSRSAEEEPKWAQTLSPVWQMTFFLCALLFWTELMNKKSDFSFQHAEVKSQQRDRWHQATLPPKLFLWRKLDQWKTWKVKFGFKIRSDHHSLALCIPRHWGWDQVRYNYPTKCFILVLFVKPGSLQSTACGNVLSLDSFCTKTWLYAFFDNLWHKLLGNSKYLATCVISSLILMNTKFL